jgi:ABC-2 type transport system permease protein
VCVLGGLVYGVELPPSALPSLVLTAAVGSIAFCGIAYALAGAIGSAESAQPIVQAIALPLYFSSGVFIPSVTLPAAVRDAASLLPVEHLSHALHRAFEPTTHATAVAWGDLAVVLAWGAAGLAVALARFRWTPHSACS